MNTLQQRVAVMNEIKAKNESANSNNSGERESTMQENVLATQNNPIRTVFDDAESASEALLKRWETDAQPEPSANRAAQEATEQEAEETNQPFVQEDEVEPNDLPKTEEIDEDPVDDADEVDQDTSDEEVEEIEIDDETLIDVVVNGNAEQASIKDEAAMGTGKSLNSKVQEVASQRKQLEENIGKTDVIFQKLIEKAEAKWKPYSEVDMLVASQSMDTEDFAQLRKEAQTAQDELRFLKMKRPITFMVNCASSSNQLCKSKPKRL